MLAQEVVDSCSEELCEQEKWDIQGQKLRSRVRWRTHGDRNSKEFYQAVCPQAASTANITGL
jgi:hypothetical protein